MLCNFGDAVGAGLVVDGGHDAARLEWPQGIDNALVIRGNDYLIDALTLADLVDHMLDERPAGICGESFGVETG